jgi:hypothetical protein
MTARVGSDEIMIVLPQNYLGHKKAQNAQNGFPYSFAQVPFCGDLLLTKICLTEV